MLHTRRRVLRAPALLVPGVAAALALASCASSGNSSSPASSVAATTGAATTGAATTAAATTAAATSEPPASSTESPSAATSASSSGSGGAGAVSQASGAIALLLPETKTTRYETFDKPYFEAALKAAAPNTTLIYSNANQSEAQQLQQANAALAQGAKVLVLDPVNGETAGAIVSAAKAKNVPVISYDRLITGGGAAPDYYISFDNERVGQLQATALLAALKATNAKGQLAWINGSPTDNNATLFAKGAHSVIPVGGTPDYKIGYEVKTPEWSPATAQQEMSAAIAKIGKGDIAGVYSANDGMATTIVAAIQQAGISPIPPLTGQDAEAAAVTRILDGQQTMTVYKAIKPEATGAAQLAVALLDGTKPTSVAGTQITTSAAVMNIPSVLLTPVAVTKDNVKDTVIADGFYKASAVCTGTAAKVCTALGIS